MWGTEKAMNHPLVSVIVVTWNGKPLPGPPPRSSFLAYTYEVPRGFLAADGKNTLSVTIEPGACVPACVRVRVPPVGCDRETLCNFSPVLT